MRATAFAVLVLALVLTGANAAAQANPVHTHMGHVTDGFRDTPNGAGFLPTAIAEANIAAQHATLGARDLANLQAMKTHSGHVLHALDPTVVTSGPGQGYGVKRATEMSITHLNMAIAAAGPTGNVPTHGLHVTTALRNTSERVTRAIELAQQIQAASTAEAAAPIMTELQTLTEQLVAGADANGDGQIGWQAGEGGLGVAEQHMNFMRRGEGLGQ